MSTRITVSELDFDQIRENLKTYLSGQTAFKDYNFDGSALSTLVDLLSYNTHYNALYTNLAFNEMFLDSASKRSSLVSLGNNFGYLPRSARSAKGVVDITVTGVSSAPQTLTLTKHTPFTGSIDGVQYVFYTIGDYTTSVEYTSLAIPYYVFRNVELYEGSLKTLTYVCTENNAKFEIPYTDIDISTLSITVQATGEIVDFETYTLVNNVVELNGNSKVYYIKEMENGSYQLSFGTSNLGKPISVGNVITLTGVVSSKTAGNGATGFLHGGSNLVGPITTNLVSASSGGAEKETAEEIRFNVSQYFFDQNRAVTPSDFVSVIKRHWFDIDSVAVWGGENNDPVVYGKVFIALKPKSKLYLTTSEENTIRETILRPRCTTSLTMEFVRPLYIELEVITTAHYNKNATARSADSIRVAMRSAITNYNNNVLKKFDGIFRMSKFSTAIDNVDSSIQSSISTIKMFVAVEPKYYVSSEYKLNIVNPIYSSGVPEEAFLSTGFYIDDTTDIYYLDDDGIGNVRLFKRMSGTSTKIINSTAIGRSTIDYSKGIVKISGLRILRLADPNFKFILKPQSSDIVSVRNYIVTIPDSRVTVALVEDNLSTGTLGNSNYIFTSSRN